MPQEKENELKEIIEKDIWGSIVDFLNYGFHIPAGENTIHLTIGLLLLLVVTFLVTGMLLKLLRTFLTRKMEQEDKRKFISIFKFIKYLVYLVVILLTMSAAGINVTVILTASAALFVGLGLALQELFQDIIAGILILVDKSLQVGDVVQVEGKVSKIFEIKLRTTRAITRDDKIVVIPNHKFISDTIYNFTQNHKTTREKVSVGVAYGSNVELVTRLLQEVAQENKEVLKNPKPLVLFEDFGDSALLFSINFFIKDSFGDLVIKSAIRYAIDKKFREHNVTIPFPQRDVHFYTRNPVPIQNTKADNV